MRGVQLVNRETSLAADFHLTFQYQIITTKGYLDKVFVSTRGHTPLSTVDVS